MSDLSILSGDLETGNPGADGTEAAVPTGQEAPDTPNTETREVPAWTSQLPADLQGNESLTKFSKLGDLGQSYIELEGKLGKSLSIPGEEGTQDDWNAFFTKLGRPDSPDGYDLGAPQGGAEQFQSEATDQAFKAKVFELGLNQGQAKGINDWITQNQMQTLQSVQQAREAARQEGLASLRQEWGEQFNTNVGHMNRAIKRFGGQDLVGRLNERGLGNDPVIVKFLAAVGQSTSEDSLITGNPSYEGVLPIEQRLYGKD